MRCRRRRPQASGACLTSRSHRRGALALADGAFARARRRAADLGQEEQEGGAQEDGPESPAARSGRSRAKASRAGGPARDGFEPTGCSSRGKQKSSPWNCRPAKGGSSMRPGGRAGAAVVARALRVAGDGPRERSPSRSRTSRRRRTAKPQPASRKAGARRSSATSGGIGAAQPPRQAGGRPSTHQRGQGQHRRGPWRRSPGEGRAAGGVEGERPLMPGPGRRLAAGAGGTGVAEGPGARRVA
jgi:hypothetical protein